MLRSGAPVNGREREGVRIDDDGDVGGCAKRREVCPSVYIVRTIPDSVGREVE